MRIEAAGAVRAEAAIVAVAAREAASSAAAVAAVMAARAIMADAASGLAGGWAQAICSSSSWRFWPSSRVMAMS